MFEWNPFSLVDSPSTCSIIFCRGCNIKCKYCYNLDLFNTNKGFNKKEILEKIKSLQDKNPKGEKYTTVNWLIISGGEPLDGDFLKFKDIIDFLSIAKEINLKTGLFTSGFSNLDFKELLNYHLLNFVNIDYKNINNKIYNKENPSYTRVLDSIENAYNFYSNFELEYLYINTVLCKSFHTKEIIQQMKTSLNEIIPNIPILYERNYSHTLGWILTPFFNDNNKLKTLGNLDFDKEKLSLSEIKNLLI
jgi:pyruvate-formate lyase-activating enzyme